MLYISFHSKEMDITDCRHFYAEEVRIVTNLPNGPIAKAFAAVPREQYMGPAPWKICSGDQAALATYGLATDPYTTTSDPRDLYHNVLVSIIPERHLNNGHPSTLALWISALNIKPNDHVYHAGCGVGYYTAILAELTGPSGRVTAIELDETLAERATRNLSRYPNVTVKAGDGATFDPGMSDAMLINAGVTHPAPLWLQRLNHDGRIVLPVTGKGLANSGTGVMVKLTRVEKGFAARVISFVAIYSFTTLRDPEIEGLISSALGKRELFKLKSLRVDSHEVESSCLIHSTMMCLSTVEP